MGKLLTKREVAVLLNISTRTIDRYRAMNYDLGVVVMPGGAVRFDLTRIRAAVESGSFAKRTSMGKRGSK